jgi:arylsulfatase A-like enzyme
LNITDWIPGSDPKDRLLLGPEDQHALPLEEQTFAERLAAEGYQTAFFGKWHLGGAGFLPEQQGFQLNKGGHDAGQPATYFYPYRKGNRFDVPGLSGGEPDEYLTDRLTEESLKFITEKKDQPFLLYLSHYAVHTPIEAKDSLEEKYEHKLGALTPEFAEERDSWTRLEQNNPSYAAMVESVDESVAAIVERLEALNLTRETIIIFTSDNGGLSTLPTPRAPASVRPLRAGKGWLYEGGIRVPLIISWPGRIRPGQTSRQLATSMDFYPTILELLGLELMLDQHVDGESLATQLLGAEAEGTRSLFWHFPHYHGSGNRPSAAIRSGNYKLIQWFEQDSLELYDLSNDLSERLNLVDSLPGKTQELSQTLQQWQAETGAKFPIANPNYELKD